MSSYTKEQIAALVDGELVWDSVHRMLSMPKDHDRFVKYLEIIQERVSYKDKVILPLAPHMNIVQDAASKKWVTKCDCGFVFGDYKENWKLNALVYIRDTAEKMGEIYPQLMAPDTAWQVYREYVCPECGTLHDVESPTPWYPVVHEFEPDIESFYKDWIGIEVPAKG